MSMTTYTNVLLRLGDVQLSGTISYDHRTQRLEITYPDGDLEVLSIDLLLQGYIAFPGEAFVKDWSERGGLTDALAMAGIVAPVECIEVGPFRSRAYRVPVLEPMGAVR